jgi:micrococcal nuclease
VRHRPRATGVVLALALATIASAGEPSRPPDLPTATVVRVVDGDTVIVRRGSSDERVRLIGVDAPEVHESEKLERDLARSGQDRATVHALGLRASAFTRAELLGHTVGLERDVEARDRYGRSLYYLWLPDGTFFNAELVRMGYARIMTIPPNVRYVRQLRTLEREARAHGRGLWALP